MSLIVFVSAFSFTIIVITIIYLATSGKVKKAVITYSSLTFILIVSIICAYMFVSPFKEDVNIRFNNKAQHEYRINNSEYEIPLPPKTILKYRVSDTQSKYVTKTYKDEIIKFYRDLVGLSSEIEVKEESNLTILNFLYEQNVIMIKLSPSKGDSNWEIFIDIVV